MASNPQSPAASPPAGPSAVATPSVGSPVGSPPKSPPGIVPSGTSPHSQSSSTVARAPAAENNNIEPETEGAAAVAHGAEEEDEGLGSDAASSTSASLSSSVRDYVFENNRRYHRYQEGRYLLPNDEPEQEREDMKHAMVVTVCDGLLHFAPISNPQRILDKSEKGRLRWSMRRGSYPQLNIRVPGLLTEPFWSTVGDEYPEAEVIGIDLSPIQPNWVPPNVKFMVDDAEAEWLFGSDTFDLVHARFVCMAIKNWPRMLTRAYDAIKPGGWIELQELRFVVQCDDDTCPPDYGYGRFVDHCMSGFRTFGVDPLSMERNAELLVESGFRDVQEKVWKVPIGTWPRDPKLKKVGLYNRAMLYDALEAVSLAPLTRGLKWSTAEVEVFLINVRKSLMDSSLWLGIDVRAPTEMGFGRCARHWDSCRRGEGREGRQIAFMGRSRKGERSHVRRSWVARPRRRGTQGAVEVTGT
ncbi:S-adenosyl-L-methionine-dependent methyltransferase [Coniochaeta ligniaria NRRL 30616]|uniref:S-adenosyl-L-methionine-dependent methyltransferase n=1 Tax=Coniochaeta ligniaria NRRL 30616 TaxID=1408157 RepID=A0A1J7I6J4_9PEZI|nr:S-adenosyl-L-methionine-dependent methyltransferase [Coniochaeta ligniaria NRRL 30616]